MTFHPRGSVAVLTVVVLAVLLAFMALGLNAGHTSSVKGELQNATDSAALAAARELDGEATGLAAARSTAVNFAAAHWTDTNRSVAIAGGADVGFGHWDLVASTFTALGGTTVEERLAINAVRVQAGREAARGNAVPTWLNAMVRGGATHDVRAAAIAVGGGPWVAKCVVPLAFADCSLRDPAGNLLCDQTIVFKNDSTDTAGLTGLYSVASASNFKALLEAAASGVGCLTVTGGRDISVQNGSPFNPLKSLFEALMGRTITAPVIHPDGCPTNPKYNHDYPVLGFTSFVITYVGGVGNDAGCPGGKGPCIKATLKCDVESPPVQAGGGFYGTIAPTTRLVR